MNVLAWHVHGAWMTSFVAMPRHRVVVPVVDGRGPDGRGRARTYTWGPQAVERTPEQLVDEDIDVVVVQRASELALCDRWLGGRRAGRDLPLVWVEHDAPQGRVTDMRHPAADRDDVALVVHVTHTNDLLWDCGPVPTTVIEHGIADPGERWYPAVARAAVVINEPARRGRVVGTDLLPFFAEGTGIDLFGIASDEARFGDADIRAAGDVAHDALLDEVARRGAYLHPYRWTSFGIALVEAMFLGMPVAVVASLEAGVAVPAAAGVVTNDRHALREGLRALLRDPDEASARGSFARTYAKQRWSLDRFLGEWTHVIEEACT